jgi:hypothetical protein
MRGTLARLRPLAAATALAAMPLVATSEPAAAADVRPTIVFYQPTNHQYGTDLLLHGLIRHPHPSYQPIAGARLILWRANRGKQNWTVVTSALSESSGGYGFWVKVGRPFDYRVTWWGRPGYTSAVSPTRYTPVRHRVVLGTMTNPGGNVVRATGKVFPANPSRPVFLQRYDRAANVFRNVGFARAATTGDFRVDARIGHSTAYYRIYVPQVGEYLASATRERRHTI